MCAAPTGVIKAKTILAKPRKRRFIEDSLSNFDKFTILTNSAKQFFSLLFFSFIKGMSSIRIRKAVSEPTNR
jgi:hypothetical protein